MTSDVLGPRADFASQLRSKSDGVDLAAERLDRYYLIIWFSAKEQGTGVFTHCYTNP